MKVTYISDLHLGRYYSNKMLRDYIQSKPVIDHNSVLVIAGDTVGSISALVDPFENGDDVLRDFITWCHDNFMATIIIPGNHEFYDGTDMNTFMDSYHLNITNKVHLVNNSIVTIGDINFVCTTMWSSVLEKDQPYVDSWMNDTRLIMWNEQRYKAVDFKLSHALCSDFIKNALRELPADKTIVVTHHCPSSKCENPIHVGGHLSSAFIADDAESIIDEFQPAYWIYGHTHYNKDIDIKNTHIVSNQMGYSTEESNGFDFGKFFVI